MSTTNMSTTNMSTTNMSTTNMSTTAFTSIVHGNDTKETKKRRLENDQSNSYNNDEFNEQRVDENNGHIPCQPVDVEHTLKRRHSSIARAIEIHYAESPLYIHHGKGQYLYDENNREYLDLMNNVAHVGHCHPKVTEAGIKQMRTLYTNARFLHKTIIDVAEELSNTLPEKLKVCFFVNSGTEANDLALRLSEMYTKRKDVIVIDHAYHGHSLAVNEISPYKFNQHKNYEKKDYVHVIPSPDVYRGKYQGEKEDPTLGELYANEAIEIINDAVDKGRKIGMFMAESMQSCGGQIIYPKGYLNKVYDHIHKLGGVCAADEVQVGFGRCGKAGYWAFEQYGVIPDIVTIGKPMGNGHPVACVITTEEISRAMEDTKICYFNTYGGNPVSMAISHAVMQVIKDEKLQENAEEVGQYANEKLLSLKMKHQHIGDVRGVGLFLGVELVKDRKTKEPATEMAKTVSFRLRHRGILISKDGPYKNVLKAKPPLVITKKDIDHFVQTLDDVLTEIEEEMKKNEYPDD